MIYSVYVDRLLDFEWQDDPWGAGFKLDMVRERWWPLQAEQYSADSVPVERDAVWHAGRIQWLMQEENEEHLIHPIEIDCECAGGRVLPYAVLIDGWHRFFAHQALGLEKINATFGGDLAVLDYLCGVTHTLPG